jgi:hypothetical protein
MAIQISSASIIKKTIQFIGSAAILTVILFYGFTNKFIYNDKMR